MILLLRIFGTLVGVCLLFCSVLLTETEEQRLQDWLARIWSRSHAVRAESTSAWVQFIARMAVLTDHAFTSVFGKALFSVRFIVISLCASIGSVNLVAGVSALVEDSEKDYALGILRVAFVAFLAVFWAAKRRTIWAPAIVDVLMLALIFLVYILIEPGFELFVNWRPWIRPFLDSHLTIKSCLEMAVEDTGVIPFYTGLSSEGPLYALITVGLSNGSDILAVAGTRLCIRALIKSQTIQRTGMLLLATVAIPVCLIVLPFSLAFLLPQSDQFTNTAVSLWLLAQSNVYSSVVLIAFCGISTLFLLHHLLWVLIQRPLYALRRFEVLTKHRRIVSCSGLALLTVTVPKLGKLVHAVIQSMGFPV